MAIEISSRLTEFNTGPVRMRMTSKGKAKVNRIKKLPKLGKANELFMSIVKSDSLRMIKNFQDGIRNNSFNLERLKDATIRRKQSLGMELPEVPLYGKGDEKKKHSYINMLRLRKLKNGYKVQPSIAQHHTSKLSLRSLFEVHENGTIIQRGDTFIRIPARPAFLEAFTKTLKDKRKIEPAQSVKRAMTEYINTGRTRQFQLEIDRALKGLEGIEIIE